MFLSKQSWVLLGLGAFAIAGCGAADGGQAADEGSLADVDTAEEAEALTASRPPPPPPKRKILSLGDSIAFGFNPFVAPTPVTNYVGYPEFAESKGHNVVNASCPGETSSSFFSATEPDNGCRQFKAAFALHDDYETTQAVFALAQIRKVKDTTKAFDVITLNIGANDLFLLQASCSTQPNPLACIQTGLPVVVGKYKTNLETGYAQVKNAGFKKNFIGITTYAVNYNDPLSVQALGLINGVLTTFATTAPVNGRIVDAYQLFLENSPGGDPCAAGFLIKNPSDPTKCDIHPSQSGRELIGKELIRVLDSLPR